MEYRTFGELDLSIITQARQGDTQAFTQLVRHYQAPVYNLAYRMLGDAAEAEDAAQETFLRAYLKFKSYKAERKFAPWLLSIASHYCIDRLRRSKYVGPSLDDDNVQAVLASEQPEPEELALMRERAEDVQHLLNELPPAYRAVVVLKYWNSLSLEEIAQATDDSIGSVKVKLFRARQAMARRLPRLRGAWERLRDAQPTGGALTNAH